MPTEGLSAGSLHSCTRPEVQLIGQHTEKGPLRSDFAKKRYRNMAIAREGETEIQNPEKLAMEHLQGQTSSQEVLLLKSSDLVLAHYCVMP